MRSQALKRRALGLATLMTSVLVPIVSAPPAFAAPIGYPKAQYVNYARAGSNVEYPGGAERLQIVGASFDSGFSVYTSQDHPTGSVQEPGGSATLTVKWGFDQDATCYATQGNPTSVRVEIRSWAGSQVGATDWVPTLNGTCFGSATKTVYFDNNPLDGDNSDGTLARGRDLVKAEGDSGGGAGNANLSGADSRGAAGSGPHLGMEFYSSGGFDVGTGVLLGVHQDGDNRKELYEME